MAYDHKLQDNRNSPERHVGEDQRTWLNRIQIRGLQDAVDKQIGDRNILGIQYAGGAELRCRILIGKDIPDAVGKSGKLKHFRLQDTDRRACRTLRARGTRGTSLGKDVRTALGRVNLVLPNAVVLMRADAFPGFMGPHAGSFTSLSPS